MSKPLKLDPRRWQRHSRDLQGIRALFPTDQSDPGTASIVAPWLSDTVQIVYPYPPEYGVENVANPAAGADFSFSVPHNQHWSIISVSFRFVASVVVVNRTVQLQVLARSGSPVFTAEAPAVQTAGQDRRYVAAAFGTLNALGGGSVFRSIPIPPNLVVADDFSLKSTIIGIDVGDQLSEIFIYRARVSS